MQGARARRAGRRPRRGPHGGMSPWRAEQGAPASTAWRSSWLPPLRHSESRGGGVRSRPAAACRPADWARAREPCSPHAMRPPGPSRAPGADSRSDPPRRPSAECGGAGGHGRGRAFLAISRRQWAPMRKKVVADVSRDHGTAEGAAWTAKARAAEPASAVAGIAAGIDYGEGGGGVVSILVHTASRDRDAGTMKAAASTTPGGAQPGTGIIASSGTTPAAVSVSGVVSAPGLYAYEAHRPGDAIATVRAIVVDARSAEAVSRAARTGGRRACELALGAGRTVRRRRPRPARPPRPIARLRPEALAVPPRRPIPMCRRAALWHRMQAGGSPPRRPTMRMRRLGGSAPSPPPPRGARGRARRRQGRRCARRRAGAGQAIREQARLQAAAERPGCPLCPCRPGLGRGL